MYNKLECMGETSFESLVTYAAEYQSASFKLNHDNKHIYLV